MSTDRNGTEFAAGVASCGSTRDEQVQKLRADLRQQTQRGDRYFARYTKAEERLWAEQAIVHRIRKVPRYTTAAGDRVVSAAALDHALEGAR